MTYHQTYKLTKEDEDLYVRELLVRRFQFSSRLLRKLKVEGGVFLNGRPVRFRHKGRAGDVLQVRFPEESSYFEPEDIPLAVVYEDEDLLVVDKQPGLVIHPTKNYQSGTLANALAHRMRLDGANYKIRFVNRLDRDTSGLVMIAKNAHCQKHISDQMKRNEVKKYYTTIVHGQPERDSGTIDLPVAKDPEHAARRKVMPEGLPSLTHYRVLERFCVQDGALPGYALLELQLVTGRTHQIRVHLTHIGLPIVGDELYGSLYGYEAGEDRMNRQALHAGGLVLAQPTSGQTIRLCSGLPDDMNACLEALRNDCSQLP